MKKVGIQDIICFTGGKCGSSTLRQTFNSNGFKSIKTHGKPCFISQFKYDGLMDLINRSSANKKLYLIDSYRTPIERKISSFFHGIKARIPDYKNRKINDLIDIFNEKYLNHLEISHPINNLMAEYGVEPFDKFDFKKRYVIKEKGNLVFIKILFSDIKDWNKILSNIFNKNIKIYSANLGKRKEYSSEYKEFKKIYKIPVSYINNTLKNDKEFKIFNTPKEQDIYINKWLKSSF